MTRIFGIGRFSNFRNIVLAGHTDIIQGCFFEENSLHMNTISRNGQLCIWECNLQLDDLTAEERRTHEEPDRKKKRSANDNNEDSEDEYDNAKDLEQLDDELEHKLSISAPDQGEEQERDAQGKVIPKSNEKGSKEETIIRYKRLVRHYLATDPRKENPNAILSSTCYHKKSKILVSAFSTGAFYLHELPDLNLIHSLNISEYKIDTVTFNTTGDWIAMGVSGVGQLLVWEWQSEHYILKQQGHSSNMNCLAYSADGQNIVTGGDDGKLKLWNVNTGFCFVTFSEHTGPITALEFCKNKKFLVSASVDGTVRAFDIVRYRNFKTLTSPRPVQFSCVAIDYSGDFVAAGSRDEFNIYLWSMKLGTLLEVIGGHKGPIVSLEFAPNSSSLLSGSWDKSIRLWNGIETSSDHETIDVLSDVVCVTFNPNGEEFAVATINGNISVFHTKTSHQLATIEGRADLGSGVSDIDLITAKKNLQTKYV